MRLGRSFCAFLFGLLFAAPAFALPSLQLGPGDVGAWTYNNSTLTWVTGTNPFSLNAYANATTGDGDFAWDQDGESARIAYLVVSAIPMVNTDLFDITVENDSNTLSIFDSGYGTPPVQDKNDLAKHGIFDTYFEIYQFQFDGSVTTISNAQPGGSGSGDGYEEEFDVTINSLFNPVYGVHFDLFTVEGDGTFDPNAAENSNMSLVTAVAPYSHDAENESMIPEPATGALILLGAASLGLLCRRTRRRVA